MLSLAITLGPTSLVGPARPADAAAPRVAPPFDASYEMVELGSVPGLPPQYGGLTVAADDTDTLLIAGNANDAAGAVYAISLVRDAEGHITGFSGTATRVVDAAFNDGGVAYGPGGVLFLARWPANELGQTRPGSTTTDRIIDMAAEGIGPDSLSALAFVPDGFPGQGQLKLVNWGGGSWYTAGIAPDGNGTFDVVDVTPVPEADLTGGPEGIIYVPPGSPGFVQPSILVSEYSAGSVAAYEVDANGDPVIGSRRPFIGNLSGAEGAAIDPVSGDFLFSTFGGDDRVVAVRGFAPPTPNDGAAEVPGSVAVVSDSGWVAPSADAAIEIVLDTSGSMRQEIEPGRTRAEVAKAAMTELVTNQIPPGALVALRTFGDTPESCDTRLAVPLQPLDPAAMATTIDQLPVVNLVRTSIGASLMMVAEDLQRATGPEIVVLVTDGEETCDGDPAAAIQALVDQGVDVHVNIVGFALDDEALRQTFQEWAQLGQGSYFDATNAGELGEAISTAVQAPFRVLDTTGDVVASGTVGGEPVAVPPGVYTVEILTDPVNGIEDVIVEPGAGVNVSLSAAGQ